MAATLPGDTLSTVAQTGYSVTWDWKNQYVSQMEVDGYERFAQYSASPDTTILYGGPARFPAISGNTSLLTPIGLVDSIQMQDNAQLMRLFEIGSNRSFFTRGKNRPSLSMGKMLADQANILNVLQSASITYNNLNNVVNSVGMTAPGPEGPIPQIMMNLGSEIFGAPFGVLVVFKTRGNANVGSSGQPTGTVLAGVYLEYCMFDGYNWAVQSEQPVIVEGVQIQFDRVVPVSFVSSPTAPVVAPVA